MTIGRRVVFGYGVGSEVVGVQFGQRLHTPQQEDEEGKLHEVQEEEVDDVAVNERIDDNQQQTGKCHHVAHPYLLTLQVGIVVAQPPPVLPDGNNNIYSEGHVNRQKVNEANVPDTLVGPNHKHNPECGEGQHGRRDGPDGPAAVLQHSQQRAADGGEYRHAVKHIDGGIPGRETRLVGGMGLAGEDEEQVPPHMPQSRHGEEGSCPAAQPHRRRDVGGKGIAPAKQQIDGSDESRRPRYTVENEEKYQLWGYVCVWHFFWFLVRMSGTAGGRFASPAIDAAGETPAYQFFGLQRYT